MDAEQPDHFEFHFDDDDPDIILQTDADVDCPWCGETVSITIDPLGGSIQEYTEDCEICCNPWRVVIRFDGSGVADVSVEQAQ